MAWEDFSMSATIVPFDPPVPLLRGPVATGPADEPSSRSFVLAFRDAASWREAYRATESKIVEQCELAELAGVVLPGSKLKQLHKVKEEKKPALGFRDMAARIESASQ